MDKLLPLPVPNFMKFVIYFPVFSSVRFSKQTVQWLQMLEAFNKALKVNITFIGILCKANT